MLYSVEWETQARLNNAVDSPSWFRFEVPAGTVVMDLGVLNTIGTGPTFRKVYADGNVAWIATSALKKVTEVPVQE